MESKGNNKEYFSRDMDCNNLPINIIMDVHN